MELDAGTEILGRYRVDGLRRETVTEREYRGVHLWLDYPVAIRVYRDSAKETTRERFKRSARMMSRVRHPNVVSILDYGVSEDTACIVTEYVEGEALLQRLARFGPLPWPEAVDVISEALRGLHGIHEAEVLHRNITPSNVVMIPSDPPIVKLVGMGLARSMDPGEDPITHEHKIVGTPTYMAPEQLLGLALSSQTDVYAIGLVLYQALCGVLPEGAAPLTFRAVLSRMKRKPAPPSVPAGNPPLPSALIGFLAKTLSPKAAERPASAKQAFEELRQIRMGASDAVSVRDTAPEGPTAAAAALEPPPLPTAAKAPSSQSHPRVSGRPVISEPRMVADPWRAMSAVSTLPEFDSEVRDFDDDGPVRPSQPPASESVAEREDPQVRGLLAARIPKEELARSDVSAWLTDLVDPAGRGFRVAGEFWIVILWASPARQSRAELTSIEEALLERFGSAVNVATRLVDRSFELASASADGTAAPPVEVLHLLGKVARR